jgi:hypothetical protein
MMALPSHIVAWLSLEARPTSPRDQDWVVLLIAD